KARWPSAVPPPWLPIAATTHGSRPCSRRVSMVARAIRSIPAIPRLPTVTATEAPLGRRTAIRLERTASATARGTSSTSGWSNDRLTVGIGGRSTSMRGPPLRDRPRSLVQQLDLDLAELDGVALGLKADRPLGDLELTVLDELPGVGVLVVELGLFVFDHEL